MNEQHQYQVALQWKDTRKGELSSPDFDSNITVVTPPEFEQGIPGHWSPEHLFTASVVSCFMTTFLAIAEYSRLEYEDFNCHAVGVLEKVEGKYLMTEIKLNAYLKINDLDKRDRAERILHKSEAACLITNSIKSKVNLTANISI